MAGRPLKPFAIRAIVVVVRSLILGERPRGLTEQRRDARYSMLVRVAWLRMQHLTACLGGWLVLAQPIG